MPPTLRSAQSSPVGKDKFSELSPGTPGRKAPKCTKCGQPRLGHPRSGCPPDTANEDINSSPTNAKSKTLQENLSHALGSMYLETSAAPTKQPEDKRCHNSRHSIGSSQIRTSETLLSISTSAEGMLQDLTKPGFFSQDTAPDHDSKESMEQDSAAHTSTAPSKLRMKSGPQILMPGTLMAPSWESSFGRLPDAVIGDSQTQTLLTMTSLGVQTTLCDRESNAASLASSNSQTSSAPPSQTPLPPRRLQKTQTQEERELFLSSLSQVSPASVYIHKKQGLNAVLASAQAAKLHVRTIESDDNDEEDILLVIGTEYLAVEKLADDLTKSIKDTAPGTTNNYYITNVTDGKSPSSTFRAIASGAIVGVVGTWAGLAFS